MVCLLARIDKSGQSGLKIGAKCDQIDRNFQKVVNPFRGLLYLRGAAVECGGKFKKTRCPAYVKMKNETRTTIIKNYGTDGGKFLLKSLTACVIHTFVLVCRKYTVDGPEDLIAHVLRQEVHWYWGSVTGRNVDLRTSRDSLGGVFVFAFCVLLLGSAFGVRGSLTAGYAVLHPTQPP